MRNIIFGLLENALEEFYAKEQRNLELDVHEIAHAHRLAIYFEELIRRYDRTHEDKLFEQYYVDVEFNRKEGGNSKEVYYLNELHKKRSDILMHRKGIGQGLENLLVIELKKEHSTDKEEQDIRAITRMVGPKEDGDLDAAIRNTLIGIYLKIGRTCYFGSKYWYEDGRVISEMFHRNMTER